MFDELPVFGICGYSGSGKTTLIEKIVPRLRVKGLKIAVVKHDVHCLDIDHPGKDSDRFFKAGADVLLQGTQQELIRIHQTADTELSSRLKSLSQQYDLVLVEGHKGTPLPKVWLLGQQNKQPPDNITSVLASLKTDSHLAEAVLAILDDWLNRQWLKTTVFGCVLIGGSSSRLGKPKHLLQHGHKTWLERTVELLQQVTDQVAIVGAGDVPAKLASCLRLPDVTDAKGPLAGILAAMRWAPQACWLVAACDLPALSPEALRWLLSTRSPGVWATLPRLPAQAGIEPLLAHYDFRARCLLEQLIAQRNFSLNQLSAYSKVFSPAPPSELAPAWKNINTPEELQAFSRITLANTDSVK